MNHYLVIIQFENGQRKFVLKSSRWTFDRFHAWIYKKFYLSMQGVTKLSMRHFDSLDEMTYAYTLAVRGQ